MNKYAIVNNTTNEVVSLVVWDGLSDWVPDVGFTAVQSDVAQIGWEYISGQFIQPPVEVAVPPSVTREEIEHLRLVAYANPITGCDRYFAEVMSLQAEGFTATSAEVKEAKAKGLARKLEIQALYPYPEVE